MKDNPDTRSGMPRGWYSRGYLRHFDPGSVDQFITFRLCDSIPQHLVQKWKREVVTSDPTTEVEYRRKIERYLDGGYGSCSLRIKDIATMVQESLLFHDKKKYTLISWVVMPNHIHVLLRPLPDVELEAVLHSIKSYTAHEANKMLNRTGQFWQRESYDRYIRNEEHFGNVIKYIERNPVKAGLCKTPVEWEFSSAHYRLRDGA